MEQPKDDLTVIFSEDEVGLGSKKYTIKPWTLKQLIGIWPLLTVLVDAIKASMPDKGASLTIETIVTLLTEDPQTIIQILLPHLPKFFSLSIAGLSEDEAGDIDVGQATVVLLKIISKNTSHLKNSLSLVVSEMAAIVGAMKDVDTTPTPS